MADREVDFLLIGGGLASANCARWLREGGSEGSILLVGREFDLPYNRPALSKGYLLGREERAESAFRPTEWWEEQRIEALTRTTVTALDIGARTAKLSTREEVAFGQVLIATGANVRRLQVPGSELEGLHYLRAYGNADSIREDAEIAEEVVLVGGSFIGVEVAIALARVGRDPTIVMQEEHTLELAFGARVGRFVQERLEGLGVRVHGGESLERFEGEGKVARVVTERGLQLGADMVVIGAGVMPDTTLARAAGLEIGPRNGVRCDAHLRTAEPGVYAAGDIAEFLSPIQGEHIRVEHWDVAFNHGRTAALNMLGQDVEHDTVPYFYSTMEGIGELEYVGPAKDWDQEVLRGSFDSGVFTNWYLKNGTVVAACTFGRSDDLDIARGLMRSHAVLDEKLLGALADEGSGPDAFGLPGQASGG